MQSQLADFVRRPCDASRIVSTVDPVARSREGHPRGAKPPLRSRAILASRMDDPGARVREDPARFGAFVETQRERLCRTIALRMDPRLRARLDAEDVLQEACVEATQRLAEWIAGEGMPLHLWLRFLVLQKLTQLHRRHVGAGMRDAGREVSLAQLARPDDSAATIASAIAQSGVLTPSGVVSRDETVRRLTAALQQMKPEDREVLMLRHFEQLANVDVARLLGLSIPGASQRYLRAAQRMRGILVDFSSASG